MVDFKISTPQDNVEVKFSIDSPLVQTQANHVNASTDSILQLAQNTGLVDAMHQVNAESAEADQLNLQPHQEEGEVLVEDIPEEVLQDSSSKRSSKSKRERDKGEAQRVGELVYQVAELSREKEAYALRLQEMELALLKKKKDDLEREVENIATVMKKAKGEEDPDAYVEAHKILSQLTHEQFKTHESLEQAQSAYEHSYQSYQEPESFSGEDNDRYQTLVSLSHKKELSSEYYKDWLDEHEALNPFSEDYNPHLAEEFAGVKKDFNNYLYAHGQQSLIGTVDYYNELDDLIQMQNERKYGSMQPYVQEDVFEEGSSYQQPYYGESDMSQPIARASIAPINRQGYQNPYAGTPSSLPALTEHEKRIAEICPMTDAPTVRGVQPRYLTNDEKYAIYQQNKAKMMGLA